MFRSIRWRIAVPYIALALVTMTGLALWLSASTRQAYRDNLHRQLADDAALIADEVRTSFGNANSASTLNDAARRYATLLGKRVTIIAADGTVLGESQADDATMPNHLDRAEVQQALASAQGFTIRFSDTLHQNMMYVAAPVVNSGQTVGVARVAMPLAEVEAWLAAMNRTLAAGMAVSLILIVVLATAIAERTAGPIRQVTQVVERMAQGDLSARTHPSTRDESRRLADAVNDMAGNFQTQIDTVTDQRDKLVAVLTHMTDGAVITDGLGQVQLVNPAAARLLGLPDRDVTAESLVAVARDHQVVQVWQRCQTTGKEQSDLVEVSGRGPFLRVVATPLRSRPGGGYLLILQDLTQVRRLETIRRDFISNISHELRNPLAALKALVETLRDGALDDRPMAERFLTQMDAEVDVMTQTVRELLELSRIESGRVPLQLAPTALADIVVPSVERLRPQVERAGLQLAIGLPDLPLVMADSERLQQVMSNLLHNAIKFTPPGGTISVSARDGDMVTISVADTGVGIAAADLPRIFERFYKADRARSGGGTGLGLAIAKHIVQAHRGRIWAESVEGAGATFHFTLPKA
jgi:two-component system, OmpR family, phosphate regulon sensor histidine kinase PhoR